MILITYKSDVHPGCADGPENVGPHGYDDLACRIPWIACLPLLVLDSLIPNSTASRSTVLISGELITQWLIDLWFAVPASTT
jgi:hypothetical protein